MRPLENMRVVTLAVNLPGPLAVARLRQLGANIIKIEPPDGDPLSRAHPEWYRELHDGVEILTLNLKENEGRARLHECLERCDLLLTATRPAALARLGLSWSELHARYPRLSQVAIVGYLAPDDNEPGHDLTYQARLGLLSPPALPRALIADWAGSQDAYSTALALLLARERGQGCQYRQVSLAKAAESFAQPLHRGLSAPGGSLGGGFAGYNLYRTRDGWIAIAALEPHFWANVGTELGQPSPSREQLQRFFLTRTAAEWEQWARERDLPISALNPVIPFDEKHA
jgi:crotonobetainyl-CoA:carnitine CoA-transferase CaiB-like acyl-CoA transferase